MIDQITMFYQLIISVIHIKFLRNITLLPWGGSSDLGLLEGFPAQFIPVR
jgi:hypothetical protein